MLSRFRKEVAALELYGKLPIAKDYLRVGGGTGAGIALRDWLDQGFSSRAEKDSPPTVAWAGRFLVSGYGGDPIMGCLWPSCDSGGLRPFPFTAFVARRRRAAATEWSSGGIALRPLWGEIRGAYTAHRSYADGSMYLMAMRGLEIDMTAHPERPTQQVDFNAWVSALWPDARVDGLVHTLTDLRRLAGDRHPGPVRLPLVGDLPKIPQVHAWWFALCELGLLQRSDLPTVFFPQSETVGETASFATFFRGPLDPSQQVWVGPPRPPSEQSPLGPGDLAHAGFQAAGDARPPSEATPPLYESLRGPLVSARAQGR